MRTIDTSTAVAVRPTPAVAGSGGWATDGNVAGGIEPTVMAADWFNAVTGEILSVLTAAGISPDPTRFDQLLSAIRGVITATWAVTAHGNSNYTIASTDKVVWLNASLTAPRTWTLPSASSFGVGFLVVIDAVGGVSATNTLTISGASVVLSTPNAHAVLYSDGTSWAYAGQRAAITGTANEISVANGGSAAAAPTLSLPTALTFTGKTVTGGTFSAAAFSGGGTFSGTFTGGTFSGGTYSGATLTGGGSFAGTFTGGAFTGGTFSSATFSGTFNGSLGAGTPAAATVTTLGVNGLATFSAGGDLTPAAAPSTTSIGYLGLPQNAQNANYGLLMADAGRSIYHTSGSAHTITIPANASVAFPVGTIIIVYAGNSSGALTIAITTDTLRWVPTNATGSRTLTGPGKAILEKVSSTEWWISGLNVS